MSAVLKSAMTLRARKNHLRAFSMPRIGGINNPDEWNYLDERPITHQNELISCVEKLSINETQVIIVNDRGQVVWPERPLP